MQVFARTAKEPWGKAEISAWFEKTNQKPVRSYVDDVVRPLSVLPSNLFQLERYGDITVGGNSFSLKRVTVGDLTNGNPNILITAGVHGCEPSGTRAAIDFLQTDSQRLSAQFNFVVYPCINPWGYQYDHRWNADAEDINRLFISGVASDQTTAENAFFMHSLSQIPMKFDVALDWHEILNRDVDLRVLRHERFGAPLALDYREIPNGSYIMLSEPDAIEDKKSLLDFGNAVISSIAESSPIASDKKVAGVNNQGGVTICDPNEGLMRTYLGNHAERVCVVEINPDRPGMTPQRSMEAQKQSVYGAMRFLSLKVA